jgi:hypothetical protein
VAVGLKWVIISKTSDRSIIGFDEFEIIKEITKCLRFTISANLAAKLLKQE